MDVLGPRSVPALIAALGLAAGDALADCAALDGTYEYQSIAPREGVPEYLSNLVHGKEKSRLFKRDNSGGPRGLGGGGTITRPKITHLATRVRLAYHPQGTRLHFLDAQGTALADLGIDYPDRWSCRGNRLERKSERTGGLGDVMTTNRIEETLSVDAKGDLVYSETVTRIDTPGGKPQKTEARFRRAQSVA